MPAFEDTHCPWLSYLFLSPSEEKKERNENVRAKKRGWGQDVAEI